MVDYVNVPRTIATVISSGKASKAELDSVLGVQDLWDLLEIIQVDAHNERVMQETLNGSGT
ncbi:transcription elongation factor GreA [Salmonella enterica subsp. diarizonae]|uniref:Transcription elongation factor GreA n=1 Tax=Salmonella diarizonae TaxID=59204 RepID=A0A3R0B2M1_SALDZ|nr:transcription elongation factor GreA [Salmonella sp. SG203]AXC68277.1 transcription elongation factor GreA [Salmonella enterica subsp. diarizonae serovar 59:z10:-]EAA3939231.1 transcription elongation factor GreA [Salmonella enterica subsp. enterica serovar Bareilly]EAA6551471.1 transcription elongation factor GreA [Salmonella enterica subsp. diarizonae]EAC1133967.1 transcription elongation factor GreA [Salmonella enterica subsp. enterica serovar Kambole]EBE4780763.1 transcription elongatio